MKNITNAAKTPNLILVKNTIINLENLTHAFIHERERRYTDDKDMIIFGFTGGAQSYINVSYDSFEEAEQDFNKIFGLSSAK